MAALLDKYKASSYKKILKDPAYRLSEELHYYYSNKIVPARDAIKRDLDSLQRIYMKAQMEMYPDKHFYPDANLTLRIAYGKVDDYYPRDAVHYDYFTTLEGIMEKEDPEAKVVRQLSEVMKLIKEAKPGKNLNIADLDRDFFAGLDDKTKRELISVLKE